MRTNASKSSSPYTQLGRAFFVSTLILLIVIAASGILRLSLSNINALEDQFLSCLAPLSNQIHVFLESLYRFA